MAGRPLARGALRDGLLVPRADDDALHVDARGVDVVRIQVTRIDQVLDLGDGHARGRRHHGVEVARRLPIDQVAEAIAFPGFDEGEVRGQRRLKDGVPAIPHAGLLAFGDLRAVAGGRVEGGNAGAPGADALGQRAWRAERDVQGARQKLPLEGLVLAHVAGGDLLHLAGVQQQAQSLAVDAAVVRDDRDPLHAAPVKRRDQVLGDAAQAEAAGHQRHAVLDVGDGFIGGGDGLVHARPPFFVPRGRKNRHFLRLAVKVTPVETDVRKGVEKDVEKDVDKDVDEDIVVHVHGLATGGDAGGRQQGGAHDGRATFIPLAAPGDEVRARVVREKARVAWAELVEIRRASPLRVNPPCPYFGVCGGCQWQHVTLDAQRAAKRDLVARALGAPVDEMLAPSTSGYGYRDRARLTVQGGAVGFRARRSHDVVDIARCLLLGDEASRALEAVRAQVAALPDGAEVDLQAGAEGVHVAVRSRAPLPAERASSICAAWEGAGIAGTIVATGELAPSTYGAPDVDVAEAGGAPLRIPAGGFAQVGRAANAALVAAVMRAVGAAPGAVLELYAGSGDFTRHHLSRASRVVAHDGDARAVVRGRRNAGAASWNAGRDPTGAAAVADTVLVDPPREGLDGETFTAATRARRRLVYVSCAPQPLGRDATKLRALGFQLRHAVALDLMPQTFLVEVVATFERMAP